MVVERVRIMLLHGRWLWSEAISQVFWLFVISYSVYLYNHLHHDENGRTLIEKFSKSEHFFDLMNIHTFRCSIYILDYHLQSSQKIPRWELSYRLGIFIGLSLLHVDNVVLVYNPFIGLVSSQYYLIFDDNFTTLASLHDDTVPSN